MSIEDTNTQIIINNGMKRLMNKLFAKTDEKKVEFGDLFNNPALLKINKSKKYDEKHTRFNVDEYNLLIRENMYNNTKSIYGWVLIDDKPVNINVTEELRLTKTHDEIFNLLMKEFVHSNKITLTKNSVPGNIYKTLNIDISNYTNNK